MPRRFAKSVLRDRIIKIAAMEGDTSIAAAELDSLMSMMYGEIYEVAADSSRYFEYSLQVTTAGLAYISEPADHLSLVDTIERIVDVNTGRRERLFPIQPQERASWSGRTGHPRRFEIVDDRINLYPTPPSGDVLELRYVPGSPDLTTFADSDVIDVVTSGGEAALIWGTALMIMSKDARNVDLAANMRDRGLERLRDWCVERLKTMPQRIYVENDEDFDGPARFDWRYNR